VLLPQLTLALPPAFLSDGCPRLEKHVLFERLAEAPAQLLLPRQRPHDGATGNDKSLLVKALYRSCREEAERNKHGAASED
jgi:hypothetical protein